MVQPPARCYQGRVDITRIAHLEALRDFHAVESAAMAHDFVALPADPLSEFLPLLDGKPRAGDLTELYLAAEDGVPKGALTLRLPLLDNLSTVNVDLSVHPEHRRRGVARALLDFALQEIRRRGRNRVFVQAPWARDGAPGASFSMLHSVGFRPVLDDYRRLLDLHAHPSGEAHPVPAGYCVRQWVDIAPDEVVDGCAYLLGRMIVDAPMGEMDYEQEKWDAERYREREADSISRRRRGLTTAVVHEATGQVAGVTNIGVSRDRSTIAYQWDTIVDPDHRGHQLGLVLKTWNHRHLAEQVAGVTHINTWNAASNTFMVAVNDLLGFEIAEQWTEFQLDPPQIA